MTWLTPLFLIAGLAVAAPIVFHLWQRTPRGRRLFSSTMFLGPSPPRVTRRSRIEQWILLCLRAFALLLLAFGFARPVWRTAAHAPSISSPDKTVAILVDRSASLRRDRFWDALLKRLTSRLDALPNGTHVGLFAFDDRWEAVVPLDAAPGGDEASRRAMIREKLPTLTPGWRGTKLGLGMARTVQALRDFESSRPVREAAELWLASDLAAGADLTGLAGVDWPESLRLEVVTPDLPPGTNAGLQWVESRTDGKGTELRVRVTNAKDSARDRFQLGWDVPDGDRVDIHVPAGQSRTMLAPPRPDGMAETTPLRLFGDDHEFDNRLWSAERRRRSLWILYLGSDAPDDPSGSRFFLEQALAGTTDAQITLRSDVDGTAPVGEAPALVIWTDANVNPPAWLKTTLDGGGAILAAPRSAEDAKLMLTYVGITDADVEEADVPEFSLLSEIDFEDPLFVPFAQARFADFTGIHFWKHRRIRLPTRASRHVLARFDDGDPFLIRESVGEGRCWVVSSGWHSTDSQLARSSKFAPLLHRLLEQSTPLMEHAARADVGSEIAWLSLPGDGPLWIRRPDGATREWSDPAASYADTDVPGIYAASRGGEIESWAVNVAPDESKTDPLPIETLERFGVTTGKSAAEPAPVASPVQQRQLQLEELERRQSLWRWFLLAAFAVLLIETLWASKRVRDAAREAKAP
jgi:hypothetical protein